MSTSPGAPDRSEIRRSLQQMSTHWRERIDGWRETGAKHTEKSYAQQFWSDLLKSFGVITERIDLFEQDATRATSGRTGYIDLFWSGVVLGEAKSLGRDLDAAYDQALDYLRGGSIKQHEFPRYVMVSDFENLRVTKLGDDGWTVAFTIDEVTDHVDQLMFLAGQETVTKAEEEEASIHASKLMANLYTAMLGDDADEGVGEDAPVDPDEEDWQVQKTSVFLTRVLFLLYGDDAGLWEEDLFYRFILYDTTGETLGSRLNALFQVLNTPENRRRRVPEEMAKFPYINGSLFADQWPQDFFDDDMRAALLAACRFHWTRISPAVFGSMFQLVKSKEARRENGEHYTTEANILKVIEPLFLDELRKKARRLIRNKSTTAKALREFRDSLAEMVFLDPACGCGNFLVVAYRELRQIETDIIVTLREKEGQYTASMDVSLDQRLSIGQFYGFELNWWPAKIAETAMFLVDHQANRALAAAVGDAPERLPISITAHIRHGNAVRMAWETEIPRPKGSTFIFGNPPFVGYDQRSESQLEDLKYIWKTKKPGRLDYVTAWYAKSMDYFDHPGRVGEFAFVSTNSVTQGEPVPLLFDNVYDRNWHIKFAFRTFVWDSDAPGEAAVHCVIIGFFRDRKGQRLLWGSNGDVTSQSAPEVCASINPYLIAAPEMVVHPSSSPISSSLMPVRNGNVAGDTRKGEKSAGGLVMSGEEKIHIQKTDPIAAKYLRPFVGGQDFLHKKTRWCLWLKDFNPADVQKSSELTRRLKNVQEVRLRSTEQSTVKLARTPYLFKHYAQPKDRYICIPRTVSQRRDYFVAGYMTPDVIVSNGSFWSEDPSGLVFAMVSSSCFMAWQNAVGGRFKSDPRFANKVVWNTFPVPELDERSRSAIIDAGKGILDARALRPERSLAVAYDPLTIDPALVKAHDKLDKAVDKAFGADRKLSTERQRLEILFRRYAEMTATARAERDRLAEAKAERKRKTKKP